MTCLRGMSKGSRWGRNRFSSAGVRAARRSFCTGLSVFAMLPVCATFRSMFETAPTGQGVSANVLIRHTSRSRAAMIRLKFAIDLRYEIADNPADFIFNIHAAQTPWQAVHAEGVTLSQPVETAVYAD